MILCYGVASNVEKEPSFVSWSLAYAGFHATYKVLNVVESYFTKYRMTEDSVLCEIWFYNI